MPVDRVAGLDRFAGRRTSRSRGLDRGRAVLAATVLALAGCSLLAPPTGSPTSSGSATGSGAAGAGAARPAADQTVPPPATVLVVDASGTMKIDDVAPNRMQAAQQAAVALVDGLPDASQVGLVVYGTSTGNTGADKPAGCQDVLVPVPVAALGSDQRTALTSQINGLAPSGYTPIGLALGRAAEQLAGGVGSIVLISDGEDTCAPPDPCEVARDLKQRHPQVTVSTVGFRTAGPASEQLSCLAQVTGGVFVTARDAASLARRLAAAADPASALLMSTTGRGGARLGDAHADLAARLPGFPGLGQATPYTAGDIPGTDLVVIVWQNCSYVFDGQARLVGLAAEGKTIDAVGPGDPAALATQVYGTPVQVVKTSDTAYTAVYLADQMLGSAFRVVLDGPPDTAGTTIRYIVLCRCLPAATQATGAVLAGDRIGPVRLPASAAEAEPALIALLGQPDQTTDQGSCELFDESRYGRTLIWGDLSVSGAGPSPQQITFNSYLVRGNRLPAGVTTTWGLHLGETADELRRSVQGVQVTDDEMMGMYGDADDGTSWFFDDASPPRTRGLTGGEGIACE